jgi:RNA polymerase sigma-70 factor (sigma-E family)
MRDEVADAPGFDVVFDELYSAAFKVAYRMLGERGEAEDIAQEALARALVHWERLAPRPTGWVVRVASNLAIDRWRRRRRPVPRPGTLRMLDPYVAERVDLARALKRLPRRQRQVVVLRYVADRSEAEVAAELGISVGSVKSHGSRALAALRGHLGEPGSGAGDVQAS